MSLTARNAQVYKGTAAVTYGSGSGVSNRELQGTATVTYGGAPTSNTALSLPGTNGSWMNLGSTNPAHFNTGTSNIFAEGWIYLNNTSGAQVVITSSNTATSTGEDWGLYFFNGTPYSFVYTSTASYTTPSAAVSSGTWNHVAFAFDSTNNKLYTWTNGTPGATVTTAGTPKYFVGNPVHIGAQLTTGISPLNGYIRDLRVVKGGNIPTTSFTPARAPFRLNTPSYVTGGSTVLSLAEQYFNPSLLNLPGTSGNYMNLGSTHPAHINSTTNNIFVECWVYAISFPNGLGFIFAVTGGSISTEEYSLWMSSTYGINWHVRNTLDGAAQVQAGTITTNRWYHIAGSWNYSNQTIYGFVNGSLVGSATLSGTPRYNTSSSVQIGAANSAGFLGDYYPFNGYIQDVRVTRGGTVPTTTFTPAAAPFGLSVPSYVTGTGTTVLSLATQYYQTGMTAKTLFNRISSTASASAKGIYSLYAINGASPLVINVRNGTTAATSDFYGDIFGNLTTSAGQSISSWLGAATGFVTTWYDQSGLGNHAAQATTALQPSITLGTPNLINFGGTGYFTIANQVMPIGNGVFTTVTKLGTHPTASQTFFWNFGTTGSAGCVGFDLRTDYSPNRYEEFFYGAGDVTGPTYTPNATVSGVYNQSSHTLHLNGAQIGTSAVSSRNGIAGNQTIGAIIWAPADGRGTTLYTGTMRDLYVFSTALSTTDRNIMENGYTGTKVQFTNRTPLTPVLSNPGTLELTIGQVITISQTAPQPANGITWTFGPVGTGLNLTSTTDYAMTLTVASGVISRLFTVTATNRAGLTTAIQFVAGGNLYPMTFPFTFTNMTATSNTGPTSITYGATNPGFGTGYAMVLGTGTTAGMQIWTVPASRTYTFTLAGAGSTASNSLDSIKTANGVIITGSTYALTAGQTVVILVGQQGLVNPNAPSGSTSGSGGTFVCLFSGGTYTPLFIAGGAGGIGNEAGTNLNVDASTGTAGRTPNSYVIGQAGGINGNGATGPTATGSGGTSGGGFFTAGTKGTNSGTAANGFLQGGEGGYGVIQGVNGGFGGGGGGGNQAGGGGGGYSGGAAGLRGSVGAGGAGGGSYSINGGFTGSVTNSGMGYVIISTPSNLFRTSLLASTPGNPLSIVVNSFNGFVYYVYGGTNSIFVMTTAGGAVTTVTPTAGYNIQAFGGGLAVNPATGIVYFQFLNGSQWGFGAIAPGTYSVTYNNTVSFSAASTGMYYLNGVIYWGRGTSVLQINVSTWAVSTYVTYGSGNIQGITAVGPDLYIMTINGSIFKNTSTTGLRSTQDYWGLASDGYYLYMGGAGTTGVYRTTVGNWSDRTQIITTGTYNLPGLIISMFYYNNAVYIAGYGNNAIILLST